MKKIAIVSTTRAEYGLLAPVIKELRKNENNNLKVFLIVSGAHLKKEYGYTIKEIEDDGVRVDFKIDILLNNRLPEDISFNQADALVKFTNLFIQEKFDALIILGDRYETLSIAIAAGNTATPIFHMCGGDTTEGAIDEWIRHSITKMSFLHFVTNEKSRKRVIQMGEDPSRVFNFGSTSVDNVLALPFLKKEEVLESIGLSECSYALCTYHPQTISGKSIEETMDSFIEAIKAFPSIEFFITKANADFGGSKINNILENMASKINNVHVFDSLGVQRYLSLMKYSEFVLGNSSSGIIETPIFGIPTVNIGDRQKGRLQPKSVINCQGETEDIINGINKALSEQYKEICRNVVNEYGDGHAAEKISKKCIETVLMGNIDLKKRFYDI